MMLVMTIVAVLVLAMILLGLGMLGWPQPAPGRKPTVDEREAAEHSRPLDHGVNSVEPR
jgi:hypothetical protein